MPTAPYYCKTKPSLAFAIVFLVFSVCIIKYGGVLTLGRSRELLFVQGHGRISYLMAYALSAKKKQYSFISINSHNTRGRSLLNAAHATRVFTGRLKWNDNPQISLIFLVQRFNSALFLIPKKYFPKRQFFLLFCFTLRLKLDSFKTITSLLKAARAASVLTARLN